jgi:AraC-like DNA-binding protein
LPTDRAGNEQLRRDVEAVLSSFEQASGLRLTVYHNASREAHQRNLHVVPLRFDEHKSAFCKRVKKTQKAACLAHCAEKMPALAAERERPFLERCHAGAEEVIVPLHHHGSLSGVGFLGPFRTRDRPPRRLPLLSGGRVRFLLALCQLLQGYSLQMEAQSQQLRALGTGDRHRRLLDFVDQQLLGNPSIGELAQHLKLSESRASHWVREVTGHSFLELKQLRRLQQAKQLLANTSLSVKEICAQTGFSGASYFCRYFRSKVGSSPLTYRRSMLRARSA